MANTTSISALLTQAVAPLGNSVTETLVQQMDQLTGQLQQLQTVNQAALESVRTNTQAVKDSTTSTGSGSTGGSVAGTVLSFLGTGLGISPLISGIARLFGGGGGPSVPPPPVKFALPSTQSVSAGISAGVPGVFALDYAQGGAPRPVSTIAPQITVQVQALDSQSFLDRSSDIAAAVRQAMLESSVLNDVVREG